MAQNLQSGALAGTDRLTFADSIKEVGAAGPQIASAASGTLVRSELTLAEREATIEFSVALRMREFPEFQERVAKGEIISVEEIATKYCPTKTDRQTVVDWLIAEGFAVQPANEYDLSVFASGSVAQIESAFRMKFARVKFAGLEFTSGFSAPSLPQASQAQF